jgi:hypothetical protein
MDEKWPTHPGEGLLKEHYALHVNSRRTRSIRHSVCARGDQCCEEDPAGGCNRIFTPAAMINVARLRPALGFRPIKRQNIRRYISPSALTKPVSQRDNMSSEPPPKFWSVGEDIRPSPLPGAAPLWNPTLWDTIEKEIDALDPSLRELSLDIHGRSTHPHIVNLEIRLTLPQAHPELLFEEKCASMQSNRVLLTTLSLTKGTPTTS